MSWFTSKEYYHVLFLENWSHVALIQIISDACSLQMETPP